MADGLDFKATIDTETFNKMLDEMERRIKGVGDRAVNEGTRMDGAFRKAALALGAFFSINFGKQMVQQIIQVRGEFEQLEIAFETMLKSKAEADKLMRQIVDFASRTPFDLKQVANGAKQLLAYGIQVEKIIPTMRDLGDIASGLSIPLGDLVYLYGTSAVQGRLMTKDLMQFANRGVPVIDELAKIMNVAKSEVLELAAQGKIGFNELDTVIKNLSSTTGTFGGLMEKQSKSLLGLISNLKDAWQKMLNEMGKGGVENIAADAVKSATALVENYQKVLDVLKVLVVTYGTYRAAIILTNIAQTASIAPKVIQGWMSLTKAIQGATTAQVAFNTAQKANIIGLIAGAIALVAAATSRYIAAQRRSRQEAEAQIRPIKDLIFETNLLKNKLQDLSISEAERVEVLEKLKKLNPELVAQIGDEIKANDQLIESIERLNAARKLKIAAQIYAEDIGFQEIVDEFENAKKELQSQEGSILVVWRNITEKYTEYSQKAGKNISADVKKMFEEALNMSNPIKALELILTGMRNNPDLVGIDIYKALGLSKGISELYKYQNSLVDIEGAQKRYLAVSEKLRKAIVEIGKESNLSAEVISAVLKQFDKLVSSDQEYAGFIPSPKSKKALESYENVADAVKKIRADIAAQEKELARLRMPGERVDTEAINNTETKLKELYGTLQLLTGIDPSKADKSVKTLTDTLNEIKKQYENYFRWVENYGKESADEQFKNLNLGGKTFLDELNNRIKEIESKPKKSTQDVESLSLLLATRDEVQGRKTRLEVLNEEIEESKRKYASLIDYIQDMQNKLRRLPDDGSEQTLQMTELLVKKISEAQRQLVDDSRQLYNEIIAETATFSEKRLAIEKDFADKRKILDRNSLGDEEYNKALVKLSQLRNEQIAQITEEVLSQSEAWRRLSDDIDRMTKKEATDLLNKFVETLKTMGLTKEELKLIIPLIKEWQKNIEKAKDKKIAEALIGVANVISDINSKLNTTNEQFNDLLQATADIIGNLGNMKSSFDAFKLSGSPTDAIAGFGSVVSLVSIIADTLDKQFGRQKRIADLEADRTEYVRRQSLLYESITAELNEQLAAISRLPQGSQFIPSFGELQKNINASRQALKEFRFEFAQSPQGIKQEFDIGWLVNITAARNEAEAIRKALAQGLISDEQAQQALAFYNAAISSEQELLNIRKEYQDYLAGTTVSGLVDDIARMFEEGKTSAADFADTFEQLMKRAMLQALKMRALEGPLQAFMNDFMISLQSGALSAQGTTAIAQRREELRRIFEQAGLVWKEFESLFGGIINADSATALSGAIKGITSEQAGLLAGQMNAIRINQAAALTQTSQMNDKLDALYRIEHNTTYIKRIFDHLNSNASANREVNRSVGA